MRVTSYPPIMYDDDVTADTIEKYRGKLPAEADTHQLKLIRASARLATMFEQAMTRANQKRQITGWPSAIRTRHDRGEHCYFCPGQHGVERTLRLSIALPLRDECLFAGAYIKSGGAQKALYLMCDVDAMSVNWIVQSSGEELMAEVVDDLFLAAFSDDAGAAKRLAPLYGFDVCAGPKS
jgi:hypothetical protein